ncbi:hypothetical protein BDW74DRAFT_87231 [Aspergillus multicolor]|uniref:uncharacterized protein n=1 Tax=Aspergillus multicolor TaxID=41759 RepID=UPI003CCE3D09
MLILVGVIYILAVWDGLINAMELQIQPSLPYSLHQPLNRSIVLCTFASSIPPHAKIFKIRRQAVHQQYPCA